MVVNLKSDFELTNMFFNSAPKAVIMDIYANNTRYPTEIMRNTKISYAHVCKIIEKFKKNKLLKTKKSGRINQIELTELGNIFAESVISTLILPVGD